MYSPAEFAPLSQASLKRLMKGHTVRVKHGSGLHMNLSKMQMKKHMSSKKKGQGGYNMTLDPYQCQMHGEGFLDDVGSAFKKVGSSFIENIAKPVASEVVKEGKAAGSAVVKEGKKRGRKVASELIHEGIPFAASTLGGIAGATLGGLSANPAAVPAGEIIGQQLGQFGGTKLADYVGQQTGYGMKLTPAMKKALEKSMKPRILEGGTLLIDQPFTARQAVDTTGKFFKDPAKTVGFGVRKGLPAKYKGSGVHGMQIHSPKKYGGEMCGGTALIDQPFTARQAVDTTGKLFKDPAKTIGFGFVKKPIKNRRGGALVQAGYHL